MTLTIKGTEYTASALTLGDLRVLTKEGHLGALSTITSAAMNADQVEATIAVIAASLAHQHPGCNREWVADTIDVGEAASCLRAVLVASGMLGGSSGPNVASP